MSGNGMIYRYQFPVPKFFGDVSSLMVADGQADPTYGLVLTATQVNTLGVALDADSVRGASSPNYRIHIIRTQEYVQSTFHVSYVPGINANYIEMYPFVGLTPYAMVQARENEGAAGTGVETTYPLIWHMDGALTTAAYNGEFAMPASALYIGLAVKEFTAAAGTPGTFGKIVISAIVS